MRNKIILGIGIALVVVSLTSLVLNSTREVQSSAPSGMRTFVASSTVKATVGSTSPITLFSATSGCTSRVITTYAAPIMLTFATSSDLASTVEPTAIFGHLQGASTTVVYDAGNYGCGTWQAYGFQLSTAVASSTISISEFKGFK